MSIIVEICCGSAEDAFEAKKAGAHRVELNSAMFLGGLTPSIGEVRIAKKAGIPLVAMVRPREGGFCYTDMEFKTMLEDARALADEGVEGIVFGILHDDGSLDSERCRKMLEVIGNREKVFHRAIDVVPDWKAALDGLIELGFDRVLTSGRAPSVHYGAPVVREMIDYAGGRIEILPGAGIRLENARAVVEATGANQIHLSASKVMRDNSAASNPSIHFGGGLYMPETEFSLADSDKIRSLVGLFN